MREKEDFGLSRRVTGYSPVRILKDGEEESADEKAERERYLLQEEKERIEYLFEKARFSVPFMVYKRMGAWKFLDELALNFHLVIATVTIAFCLYF